MANFAKMLMARTVL